MRKVRPLKLKELPEKGETAVVFGIIRAECSDNYNEFTYVDTMSPPWSNIFG